MFKRCSALILVLLMLFSAGFTGLVQAADSSNAGDSEISQEKAVKIVKTFFPEICSDKAFEVEYENYNEETTWNLRCGKGCPGRQNSEFYIRAVVNARSGDIKSFEYQPDIRSYEGKTIKYSRDEALLIARDFLQKINADKIDKLQFNDTDVSPFMHMNLKMNTDFCWSRIENGIKVAWDGIGIRVDLFTGQISRYYCQWTDALIPPVGKIISKEELCNKVLDEIGVCPLYRIAYGKQGYDSKNEIVPVYIFNTKAAYFDATTGKLMNYWGKALEDKNKCIYEQRFIPDKSGAVIQEALPVEKISPQLGKSIVEEFFKSRGIQGEVRRSGGGSSGGPGYKDEYWSYNIDEDISKEHKDISVDIDVNTGKIRAFHYYGDYKQKEGKDISYNQALTKAKDLIKDMNPEMSAKTALCSNDNWGEQDDRYTFNFSGLINGIPYDNNRLKVAVDKKSGDILDYFVDYHPGEFKALTGMISEAEAVELIRAEQAFELSYIFPRDENRQFAKEAVLVYQNMIPYGIDALTGKVIEIIPENDNDTETDKLRQHWAAAALSALGENNLLPDEEFDPDSPITHLEAIKIMVAADERCCCMDEEESMDLRFQDIKIDDPCSSLIKQAVQRGFLLNKGKFAANQVLTREELAVWLVNGLGYHEIAEMNCTVQIPFKDADKISSDKKNYVGIISGLDMLTADDNAYFRPQASCTWAEMATAVLRAAPKLKEVSNMR